MNLEVLLSVFRWILYIGTFAVAVGSIGIGVLSSKLDAQKDTKIDSLLAGNQELHNKIDGYKKEEELNKTKVLEVVGPNVNSIIKIYHDQYSQMAIAAGKLKLDIYDPSEEQIREVLSQLKPKDPSIMATVQEKRVLNWLEFMNQYNQHTIMLTNEIYQFMPFLDSELINILGELKDCYHFKEIQLLANTDIIGNEDLSFVPFVEYKGKISKLETYYDNNLKGFGINKPAMAVIPMIPEGWR